jgi:hypothetical protein
MQKYQHIFDTFKHNDSKHKNENSNTYSSRDYTEIDLLPRASNDDVNDDDNNNNNNTMKDELKMFLKKQLTSF